MILLKKLLFNMKFSTLNSFFKAGKRAQIFMPNIRLPFSVGVGPAYSLMSRFVVTPKLLIKMILRVCDYAKVFPAIIKTITVNMINKHIVGRLHDETVHHYVFPLTINLEFSLGVKSVSIFSCIPIILRKKIEIFIINNRDFVLSKFNFPHRSILPCC